MTNITTIVLKIKLSSPKTFYFNPPILDVKGIQFCDMWVTPGSFLIFCDIIDSSFSLSNLHHNDEKLTPNNLIGISPRGLNTMFKTNSSIVSKLNLVIKNNDLTTPIKDDEAILNLKIYHDRLNERL